MVGIVLALYGLAGVVIFVVVAASVARPLERARTLAQSVDDERAALVDSLTQAETTIRGMSTSVQNMDASLADAKVAVDNASTISHGVAQSMYGLRDAMNVEIPLLGQPLSGLAPGFETSAQNLDQLGTNISDIGTALDTNRADVKTTSQDLVDLADSVSDLTDSVENGPAVAISPGTLDRIRLAVYAVTGWLVVFAVGCLLAGAYLVNHSRARPTHIGASITSG
jgi:hypothetical protein